MNEQWLKWLPRAIQKQPHLPPMPMPRRVIFYADGAITPKQTGIGVVGMTDSMDGRDGRHILTLANRTLRPMTNNEAEYQGLLLVLELAGNLARVPIEVRMDSEIVIYQMKGRFSVHSPALKMLHREACARVAGLAAVSFVHIPREQNRLADALAGDAAGGRLWTLTGTPISSIKPD